MKEKDIIEEIKRGRKEGRMKKEMKKKREGEIRNHKKE
jgi:hypothetical protein